MPRPRHRYTAEDAGSVNNIGLSPNRSLVQVFRSTDAPPYHYGRADCPGNGLSDRRLPSVKNLARAGVGTQIVVGEFSPYS